MKIIDSIKEATIIQIISALLGVLILLIGSVHSEAIPLILPILIQQLPKIILLKILTLATILCILLIALSVSLYLRLKTKLIPKFGVLWDKNKEAYCPSCKIPLFEYNEQENGPPIYEFTCIGCNSDIRLTNFGEPISLKDAQKLIK